MRVACSQQSRFARRSAKETEMPSVTAQQTLQERLGTAFNRSLPVSAETENHLARALAETLDRRGTLVRAELVFHTARSFRLEEERAVSLATALEYFHTASLLFDDLPCMDDAAVRRGAPCLHRTYGEGTAILAALGLINRAYALLWQAVADADSARRVQTLAYVERYLGLGGLLNGQSEDIHYKQLPSEERNPQKVAVGKTVSLIRLSLVLPAMLGEANEQTLRLLDRLALAWGLAYQTVDDLKDVLRDVGATDKSTGRDTVLNRPNLALAVGAAEAFERLRRLLRLSDRIVHRLQQREASLFFLEAVRERFAREYRAIAREIG